jgi:hypothetical protein
VLDDGSRVVSLLDTTRPDSAPQHIAQGSLGIFNW